VSTASPSAPTPLYSFRQGLGILASMMLITLGLSLAALPLNLMIDPVRRTFGASDVQISLLLGIYHSVPMLAMSLLGGWMADRHSRRLLLTAGIVLWAAGGFVCAYAADFDQLALGRILLGLGTGIKLPVAMTWVNDAFPPERRGRSIGAFFVVLGVGPALAATFSGVVLKAAEAGAFSGWPLAGALEPWRATQLLLTVPSLLTVLLPLLLSDRRSAHKLAGSGSATSRAVPEEPVPWIALAGVIAALSLVVTLDGANMGWLPTVLRRSFGLDAAQAGLAFGTVAMVAGIFGPLLGGWLGDRAYQRRGVLGRLWVCSATSALGAPLLLAYLGASAPLLLGAITVSGILTVATLSMGYVSVQALLPPGRRGFGTGITSACTTLVSAAGPTLVALVAERVLSGPQALAVAICIVAGSLGLAAALTLAFAGWASRSLPRD
jgi:MFS family permease